MEGEIQGQTMENATTPHLVCPTRDGDLANKALDEGGLRDEDQVAVYFDVNITTTEPSF